MSVQDFTWDDGSQTVSWTFNGRTVIKKIHHAFFAPLDSENQCVVVEAGENYAQDQLYYFSFEGNEIFKVDKRNDKVSWNMNDQPLEVDCNELSNAQLYLEQQVIIVIATEHQHGQVLKGYALSGTLLFVQHPPEGFLFTYLSTYKNQPSVICDGDASHTDSYGRSRWHFTIHPKTGELSKENLAY